MTREWKPTVDTAGNGYAVIRFLPPHKGLRNDVLGLEFSIMAFKALVENGISRTLSQL